VSARIVDGKTSGWRPELIYSSVLLTAALAVLAVSFPGSGLLAGAHGWGAPAFFFVFALFTIATGFPHPVFGHVSFDRVAQIMSILVLGPVDAAWVNGLASLVFPWYRLRFGVPVSEVVTASLHNAGLMTLVILGAGSLYQYFGGAIPLAALDVDAGLRLLGLVVVMQVINDVGMMIMLRLRGTDPVSIFNLFTLHTELVAAAAGIVLALAFTTQTMPFFVLLLLVLSAGMLVIMQYALMRYRLEKIVDERTEELRVQAEKFERQATHDKLTRLPNRRYADSYLQQQIDLAQRNRLNGAIALADIDHFKRINDGHTHAVGDRVLQRIARILRDGCRKTDFVARYGGEEFLLYFPSTSARDAGEVCSELRRAVENAEWFDIAPQLKVTISFGLAEIGEADHRATIVNEADLRLYRAKREGRNRVVTT
jgi:diguanylate cyclase (GGDEF)-like protein